MSTIADMFTREDRVEITVSQLMGILEKSANVKAENRIIKKMLDKNFTAWEIAKIFCESADEELLPPSIKKDESEDNND